jgi:hypothetical protein
VQGQALELAKMPVRLGADGGCAGSGCDLVERWRVDCGCAASGCDLAGGCAVVGGCWPRSGGGCGSWLALGGGAACWGLAVLDGAVELRLGCFATPILARNLR